MANGLILHNPRLDTVKMVEETIKQYSQEFGKYQLWKKLPKKMMYQTYQVILGYLEDSGKIIVDSEGIVIWVFNPARIKNMISQNLRIR
ncbi:hypothetical protein HN587_01810 [Candidatus Woesearchaeota archaeon]|jgi:hypothetical protein|nr:hypothetical protein [Candidatus Woesearchaeota archaeon]